MTHVPKYVHLIWIQGEDQLPSKYRANVNRWIDLHPGWGVVVWGLDNLLTVARASSPEFLDLYNVICNVHPEPNYALLSDVFRGMLLSLFGGVYSDVDYYPIRSFEALAMATDQVTIGRVNDVFINNAVIIAPVGSQRIVNFWRWWVRTVKSNVRSANYLRWVSEALYVMAVAGPHMWATSRDVLVLPEGVLYHVGYDVKMSDAKFDSTVASTAAYGVHLSDGEWVKKSGLDHAAQNFLVGNSNALAGSFSSSAFKHFAMYLMLNLAALPKMPKTTSAFLFGATTAILLPTILFGSTTRVRDQEQATKVLLRAQDVAASAAEESLWHWLRLQLRRQRAHLYEEELWAMAADLDSELVPFDSRPNLSTDEEEVYGFGEDFEMVRVK